MFSSEEKKRYVGLLQSKHVNVHCPMCNNTNFIIADSFIRNDLQSNLKSINIGGPSIPSIAIICSQCGFISQHAIGVLGLLKNEEESKNAK